MKLIAGLGNFPEKYAFTRHNLGFLAVAALVKKFDFPEFKLSNKFLGKISEGEIFGKKVILCKPETYMNLSGDCVSAVENFYKIEPKDTIILHDDLDLDFGVIKFKKGGGSGGHNGIKSIITRLGTENFPRIKFGISNPQKENIPAESFVLMNFSEEEKVKIPEIIEAGIKKLIDKLVIE